MQKDPLPLLNRYAYAGNNAANLTDPSGLWPCPFCGKAKNAVQTVVTHAGDFAESAKGVTTDIAAGLWSLNCLDAAIGVGAILATVALPEFAPGIALGYQLAHGGLIVGNAAAFAVAAGINASQIDTKEGVSINNVVNGGGIAASGVAAASAVLWFAGPGTPYAASVFTQTT